MSEKPIIGLVGEMQAGKTTVARLIKILLSPETVAVIASGPRSAKAGPPKKADLEWAYADMIVYDCVHTQAECALVRSFERNLLIWVDASTPVRFIRYCASTRQSVHSEKAALKFEERDLHPKESHEPHLAHSADIRLPNSLTEEALKIAVKIMIENHIKPRLKP
jgi:hypothetical protein